MKRNDWIITLGMIWTIVFSGMSFYWAMGGRIGVRSLGGAIYEISFSFFYHHRMADRCH
ncbi:hypothetical protein [Virgibacillus kimchii]